MEDRFFYPDDSVVPIEVGDGYKDYMLNDILAVHDLRILYGRIKGSIADINIGIKNIQLLPYVSNQSIEQCLFNDVRVRFLCDSAEPVWVSLFFDGLAVPINGGNGYGDFKLSQLHPKSSKVVLKGWTYLRDEEGLHTTLEVIIEKPNGVEYVCSYFPIVVLPCKSLNIEHPFCFTDALIRIYNNQSCGLVGLYYKDTYLPIVGTNPISLPKPLLLELKLQESSEKQSHWGIVKNGCSFSEDNYLYPSEEIPPIEEGDGYRDYRLSAVLQQHGYQIGEGGCEIRFARNGLYEDISVCYLFALAHLSNGKCVVLAPINYYQVYKQDNGGLFRLDKPIDEAQELASTLIRYADIRIRYYLQGNKVNRPVWVSAYGVGKRFFQKEADGKDRLVYPEIELASGYEQIPYCTELIEGSLIEPDLVHYDDIINRLLKSPFIDYAE